MDHSKQNRGSFNRGSVSGPILQHVDLITLKPRLFKLFVSERIRPTAQGTRMNVPVWLTADAQNRDRHTGRFTSSKSLSDVNEQKVQPSQRTKWFHRSLMPFSEDGKLMAVLYIFFPCCAKPPECNNTERKGLPSEKAKSFSAPDTEEESTRGPDNGFHLIVNEQSPVNRILLI